MAAVSVNVGCQCLSLHHFHHHHRRQLFLSPHSLLLLLSVQLRSATTAAATTAAAAAAASSVQPPPRRLIGFTTPAMRQCAWFGFWWCWWRCRSRLGSSCLPGSSYMAAAAADPAVLVLVVLVIHEISLFDVTNGVLFGVVMQ